jgi:hypothetical protein
VTTAPNATLAWSKTGKPKTLFTKSPRALLGVFLLESNGRLNDVRVRICIAEIALVEVPHAKL